MLWLAYVFFLAKTELSTDANEPAINKVANATANNSKNVWGFFVTVTILFQTVSYLFDITIP